MTTARSGCGGHQLENRTQLETCALGFFGLSEADPTLSAPHLASSFLPDSNVQHGLGDGQYEIRVRQCASAVKTLQLKYPEMKSLRDATLAQLQQVESAMDEVAFFRARHVVMENDRVQQSDGGTDGGTQVSGVCRRFAAKIVGFSRELASLLLPLLFFVSVVCSSFVSLSPASGLPSVCLAASTLVWAS